MDTGKEEKMYWLERRVLEVGSSEETIIARMQIHQKTWRRWIEGKVWFKSSKHAERLCRLLRTTLDELTVHWGEKILDRSIVLDSQKPEGNRQTMASCHKISGPTIYSKEIQDFLRKGGVIQVLPEAPAIHHDLHETLL